MILDYLAIGLIVVCLIIVIVIIARKFPILAAIETTKLIKHKQDKVKKDLIEDRLKRKLAGFNFKKIIGGNDQHVSSASFFESVKQRIKNLESRYRQKIEELQPSEQPENEKKKSIVMEEAKKLFNEEKFKEAEAKYIEAISLDPKYVEAYTGLADTYTAMKDYVHAKETYKFILKLNSTDDHAYDYLGDIAMQEGKYDEAEKDYLKSLSLNNKVAVYHADLGDVYLAMGDNMKAMQSYQEAITLEPNNPRYLDSAISISIALKDKINAQKYFDKLKSANPENEKLAEIGRSIDTLK